MRVRVREGERDRQTDRQREIKKLQRRTWNGWKQWKKERKEGRKKERKKEVNKQIHKLGGTEWEFFWCFFSWQVYLQLLEFPNLSKTTNKKAWSFLAYLTLCSVKEWRHPNWFWLRLIKELLFIALFVFSTLGTTNMTRIFHPRKTSLNTF